MKKDFYLFSAEIIKRNIQYLVHFTPTINLVGMCETGYILPRHELIELELFNEEMKDYTEFTDEVRLDGDKYINTSIQHPNDFLLKKFKERSKDKPWVRWCILKINPKYIYDDETLFSVTNAANRYNRENVGVTGDFNKFKSMFSDTIKVVSANYSIEKKRNSIPDNLTTDSQAEVLIKKKIPLSDIIEIAFECEEDLVLTKNALSSIPCQLTVDSEIFKDRSALTNQKTTYINRTLNNVIDTAVPQSEIKFVNHGGWGAYEIAEFSQDGKRYQRCPDVCVKNDQIKEGVEIICDESFNSLYSEIEGYHLNYCRLIIPSSVKYIGKNVFDGEIEQIINKSPYFLVENELLLSSDKKRLYRYFGKCKNFIIPDYVEEIIGGAFTGMSMESITIPQSVSIIGDNPFANNGIYAGSTLQLCRVISNSKYFSDSNDCLIDKRNNNLIAYFGNSKDLEIPEGVEKIGRNAFFSANFETANMPSSIKEIDETAFYGCSNLKFIYVLMKTHDDNPHLFPKYLHDRIIDIPF